MDVVVVVDVGLILDVMWLVWFGKTFVEMGTWQLWWLWW